VSLRGRLIAGLLAVAAAGLLVAALATYVAQRSFLVDRVDDQARGAVQEADRALGEAGFSVPGDRGRRFGGPGPGRGRGGSGFGPPGRGPGEDLPAGTAIQRRTDDGAVVGSTLVLGASRA
jgi:two-component system, OmpR family, sensor kinase